MTDFRVAADLSIEQLVDLIERKRAGDLKLALADGVPTTPEIEAWLRDCDAKLLASFEAELRRRTN